MSNKLPALLDIVSQLHQLMHYDTQRYIYMIPSVLLLYLASLCPV